MLTAEYKMTAKTGNMRVGKTPYDLLYLLFPSQNGQVLVFELFSQHNPKSQGNVPPVSMGLTWAGTRGT